MGGPLFKHADACQACLPPELALSPSRHHMLRLPKTLQPSTWPRHRDAFLASSLSICSATSCSCRCPCRPNRPRYDGTAALRTILHRGAHPCRLVLARPAPLNIFFGCTVALHLALCFRQRQHLSNTAALFAVYRCTHPPACPPPFLLAQPRPPRLAAKQHRLPKKLSWPSRPPQLAKTASSRSSMATQQSRQQDRASPRMRAAQKSTTPLP